MIKNQYKKKVFKNFKNFKEYFGSDDDSVTTYENERSQSNITGDHFLSDSGNYSDSSNDTSETYAIDPSLTDGDNYTDDLGTNDTSGTDISDPFHDESSNYTDTNNTSGTAIDDPLFDEDSNYTNTSSSNTITNDTFKTNATDPPLVGPTAPAKRKRRDTGTYDDAGTYDDTGDYEDTGTYAETDYHGYGSDYYSVFGGDTDNDTVTDYQSEVEAEEIYQVQDVLTYIASMKEATRREAGHTFQDMVIDCVWLSNKCVKG